MPLSRRYNPEHPPGETCSFGLDYSFVVPPGLGLVSGSILIFTNSASPVNAEADWTIGPVTVRGRALYCQLSGGIGGQDYQIHFTATDSAGNIWPRTVLILCGATS